MSSTIETLRRMSRDIARNLEYMGHDKAVLATADHINKFWDPRMKELIYADDHSLLVPIAREAIEKLQAGAEPPAQTRATEFNEIDEIGHNDAG
ncbi:MAG TPA: formate dehydrogenase subunit delta [Sphingomonadaceae bacterium]